MNRFAQLTYTSFDRHDGRGGGWQVKDVTGAISPQDQQILCARVATQFDPGIELPRFPTPAEVAELPHQMVYAPIDLGEGTALVTWHTAPAGYDASGRPGNVFAHLLVNHHFEPEDGIRPIERWRSRDWLIPFGPENVLAAELGGEVPAPGPVDRRTVASWLFAPRQWRTNTLAAILDALAGSRDGGKPVVVATEDVDEAANWIAAVSLCSSVGTAGQLAFSTLERASGLRHAVNAGIELICIPQVDAPALARDEGIVLIDSTDHVDLGDLGGRHRTARGDEIATTAWSAMMLDLFADPETMVERVDLLDQIAASVGDRELHPMWPAAVLVSREPDGDLKHEAVGILSRESPANLKDADDIFRGVATNLETETASTAEAWAQVVQQGAHDDEPERNLVLAETAVALYTDRALEDADWLAQPGAMRLPARHLRPAEVKPQWLAAAARQLHQRDPLVLLHTVELVLRMGLDRDEHIAGLMRDGVERQLAPLLMDPARGGSLAEQVESIGVEARHLLWRALRGTEAVRRRVRPPGGLIPAAVTDLLGPAADEPDPLPDHDPTRASVPVGQPRASVDPMLAELAFAAIRRGGASEEARVIAAWAQLEYGGLDPRGNRIEPGVVSELMRPCWNAAHMSGLADAFGEQVPVAWHLPHLMGAPAERDWQSLWQRLVGHSVADLSYLATLRLSVGQPPGPPDFIIEQINAIESASGHEPLTDPDAIHRAHLLLAAALLNRANPMLPRGFGQPVGRFSATEVRLLSDWGRQQDRQGRDQIPASILIEVLGRGAAGSPLFEGGAGESDAAQPWLFALSTAKGERSVPLVVELILDRVRRPGPQSENRDGAAEFITAINDITGIDERGARDMERWLNGWLRHERRREGW